MAELSEHMNVHTENELTRLQQWGLKKFAEVWTADEKSAGQVIRLHHRTYDVNPELKLYATYLESNSIEMGGPVFIPTDFMANYEAAANRIILSVPMQTVQREAWDRTPTFIAHHNSRTEELPA